jgi:hypothetical protein
LADVSLGRDASIESESGVGIEKNLATFVYNTRWLRWNLTTYVVNYAVFASEVTGDDIMSDFFNEGNGEAGEDVKAEDDGDNDDENVTFTAASNRMRRRRRCVMPKKDISECLLESIEIL